jgi:energy-coupling factor transporter ATP-binding protein EcfA2
MGMLLVVTGPPGAGKSTVARVVAGRFDPSALIEGDAFFAFLDQGAIPPWLPESNAQNDVVTRAAAAATGQYALGGLATVYEGVVGPWFLPTFLEATGLDSLHYAVLFPTVDVCLERVATRSGHGFSDEPATRKMHAEFERAAIAPRHLLRGAGDAEATATELLERLRAGDFRYELP